MSPRVRARLIQLSGAAVFLALLVLAVRWETAGAVRTQAAPSGHAVLAPGTVARTQMRAATVAKPVPRRAFVVGDSLTVGTEPWLASALHQQHWTLTGVNARVGRPVQEGLAVLRAHAKTLPATVVVALGTNDLGAGPRTVAGWLRTSRAIVGNRRLIWVNLCLNAVVAPRLSGFRLINASLTRYAARYGVQVADWCAYATRHRLRNGPDGIHYGPVAYRQRALFYALSLVGQKT